MGRGPLNRIFLIRQTSGCRPLLPGRCPGNDSRSNPTIHPDDLAVFWWPENRSCRKNCKELKEVKLMDLAYFTMPLHPASRPFGETLQEDREAFLYADELGFTEAYMGEHVTDIYEPIPNSMLFLASIAYDT
ncbi:MAG: hypothetical protein VB856_06925, partial [Rhodospirillales bacterium]